MNTHAGRVARGSLVNWDIDASARLIASRPYNVTMKQIVFEVVESLDGGYEATALGHNIFTQGEDWEDLKSMVQDAVRCHFELEMDVFRIEVQNFAPE